MVEQSDNTTPPSKTKDEIFEKFAREISYRDSQGSFEFLPHGSRLYFVEKGWKSFMIENDPKAVEVVSLLEFERAVCDAHIHVIYIPVSANITPEGMKRVCQRNAAHKAVFKEVDK